MSLAHRMLKKKRQNHYLGLLWLPVSSTPCRYLSAIRNISSTANVNSFEISGHFGKTLFCNCYEFDFTRIEYFYDAL